jgi:hypothetical protein
MRGEGAVSADEIVICRARADKNQSLISPASTEFASVIQNKTKKTDK